LHQDSTDTETLGDFLRYFQYPDDARHIEAKSKETRHLWANLQQAITYPEQPHITQTLRDAYDQATNELLDMRLQYLKDHLPD
jgi:hypothetical protein